MEIGEFMLFARDFKIPLKKSFLLELFKKSSENRKNVVTFYQFTNLIDVLGQELVNSRIKEVKERLAQIEKIQKEREEA